MQSNTSATENRIESADQNRAEWESFSFRVPTPGKVNVANHSYGDAEAGEHCYTVSIEAGRAVSCSCPHWEHRTPVGGCKHMRACEAQDVVMNTARVETDETDETDDPCPHGNGWCVGPIAETAAERALQCIDCK